MEYTVQELKDMLSKAEDAEKNKNKTHTASNLSVLTYANNFTLWHYTTIDTALVIEAAGYFYNASDILRVNDLMIINMDTDGTPATKFYIVTANIGDTVTVATYC